jgi:Flp pilus assembly protein TadG
MFCTVQRWLRTARERLGRFAAATAGSTAVTFAVSMPVVVALGGMAMDYSSVTGNKNRLQQIVDAAALSIAREMSLTLMTNPRAQLLAEKYVDANIEANTPYKIRVVATLVDANAAIRVEGTQQVSSPFGTFERLNTATTGSQISAVAVARPAGVAEQMKLCVLSLNLSAKGGVNLRNGSRLTANGCMMQSNSTNKQAVVIGEGSTLKANTVCARGGIRNLGASVEANVITDCPEIKDPLATKTEPTVDSQCKMVPAKISKGNFTFDPGTYCNGMQIHGTAKVKFNPGIYVFKDGSLRVQNQASLEGNGVTLLFTGKKAYFRFEHQAEINLTAPTAGTTAGMLIWESKNMVEEEFEQEDKKTGATKTVKITNQNRITSERAKVLTGTIYLKKGILTIDSTQPVADQSPFTILVVDRMDLHDGPDLVINSNYQNSPVPVPFGLGTTSNLKVHLQK